MFPCKNAHEMKEDHTGLVIRSNNKEIPHTLKLQNTMPAPCRLTNCKKKNSTTCKRSKCKKLKDHTLNSAAFDTKYNCWSTIKV